MAFPDNVIFAAWARAGAKCECTRKSHGHFFGRCYKTLVWDNRGRDGYGAWEAHHINSNGGDQLSNCEILCWECHKNTGSFGG